MNPKRIIMIIFTLLCGLSLLATLRTAVGMALNKQGQSRDLSQIKMPHSKNAEGVSLLGTASVGSVNSVNQVPLAFPDRYETNEDVGIFIQAPGLLSNDVDLDGDMITAAKFEDPKHGTVQVNNNGSFVYAPDDDYYGLDSFMYVALDRVSLSDPTQVTITISPVNDPPDLIPDHYYMDEDASLTIISASGVLSNDFDVEGDTFTLTFVTTPSHGLLNFSFDGSFVYTPEADYYGVDTFTYGATDGQANSHPGLVTIHIQNVNDPPIAIADVFSTTEEVPFEAISTTNVLTNDFDIDNLVLTATVAVTPANGTLAFLIDGTFIYTPDRDFFGLDTFTYQANDGRAKSEPAQVAIFVAGIDDPPVSIPDSYYTDEDDPLDILAEFGVLANDINVDDDILTATLITGPVEGDLNFEIDGSFTYTPPAEYSGLDHFTYRSSDGLSITEPATVTITVHIVDDRPVAEPDNYATIEEHPLVVISTTGVLSNDYDIDSIDLTSVVFSEPENGALYLNLDGSFIYSPEVDFFGVDIFSYQADDGFSLSNPGLVSITVSGVDDPPRGQPDLYFGEEDSPLMVTSAIGVLSNDIEVDRDPLTATLVVSPNRGELEFDIDGSFTYTPETDYNGQDTFFYLAGDGHFVSKLTAVTVTISAVNDPPVARSDSYFVDEDKPLSVLSSTGVLFNDFDIDSLFLTATIATGPGHGTVDLQSDGSFHYLSQADYFGTDSFTYQAGDGAAFSEPATVTITVGAVNDPPVALSDSYTTEEDQTLFVISTTGVLSNDFDIDSAALTVTLHSPPSHGIVNLDDDGSFAYTPNGDYNGVDYFLYQAGDGQDLSDPVTVTITVAAVNDPPFATSDTYVSLKNTTMIINAPGVLANDGDVDGDQLTAIIAGAPISGDLGLNLDGSFVYTPAQNFVGIQQFTYSASDGEFQSNVVTTTLTIRETNVAPVAIQDDYNTAEDVALIITTPGLLSNDIDADNDPLQALTYEEPTHGMLDLEQDGSFVYTPADDFFGLDAFSYRATDGIDKSAPAMVTITVSAVNDPPVAGTDRYTINEDQLLTVFSATGVLANDFDVDSKGLTALKVDDPEHGLLTLNDDGSFVYDSDDHFFGLDIFRYRSSDGESQSAPVVVTITVNAINDPPEAFPDSYTTDEDMNLFVGNTNGVLSNDIDIDDETLTVTLQTSPAAGKLEMEPDGGFNFTPTLNYFGIVTFTYRVRDRQTESNLTVVTVTVKPVNDPPLAQADIFTTTQGSSLRVKTPGILLNDSDIEGQPLSVVPDLPPISGTLALNKDGSFVFTPTAGLSGIDSFSYYANDGQSNSLQPAIVNIVIVPRWTIYIPITGNAISGNRLE